MPIATSNISFSNVQTEFGGSNPISLSEYYKGGSNVNTAPANGVTSSSGVTYTVSNSANPIPTSGAINIGSFKGTAKKVTIAVTITANQSNFDLRSAIATALGSFTAGIECTCTINAGVVVYSTSTATPAFTTGTGWGSGSTFALVNNGSIIGDGGNGGNGGSFAAGTAGGAGGTALNLTLAATITNGSGTLSGGGGGGGGGGSIGWVGGTYYSGGGGGGGGQSFDGSTGGSAGGQVNIYTQTQTPAAGGSGSNAGAGTGGIGGQQNSGGKTPSISTAGSGGNGGAYGATGSAGGSGTSDGGSFNQVYSGGSGGAGGYYLVKNGNSVTFISNGTRNGSEV